jgi:hypothetical protein
MNLRIPALLLMLVMLIPALMFSQDSIPAVKDSVVPASRTTAVRQIRDTGALSKGRDSLPRVREYAIPVIKDTVSLSYREHDLKERFNVTPYPSIYGSYVGGFLRQDDVYHVTAPVRRVPVLVRTVEDRDWIFYLFCGILLFVAFINLSFGKYLLDLFRVFFNTSMQQKQIREQLSLTPLPSLMLNILCCLSGSIFLFFVMQHYGISTGYNAAVEILIIAGCIAAIYIGKYIFVTLLGWMFDKKQAAEKYLFTVFLVNKVIGIVLLPMALVLAYGDQTAREVTLTLTVMLLVILGIMRLAKGFLSINGLKINLVQFLVFVGAFEVIPALVIYKVLLRVIV